MSRRFDVTEKRSSCDGQPALGGAYLCVLRDQRGLLDTAISYLEAGLESNEFCVWAVSDPISLEEATNSVRRVIPDGDRYLGSVRIEILPASEWYLKKDRFDLKRESSPAGTRNSAEP